MTYFEIAALLDGYAVTHDLTFIDQAVTFTDFVLVNFLDEIDNLFYFTAATLRDIGEYHQCQLVVKTIAEVENLRAP